MADVNKLYDLWCAKATDDADLQTELNEIKGDDEAVLDRFYRGRVKELYQ